MNWQDDFKNLMQNLNCFDFAPREQLILRFCLLAEVRNYLVIGFMLTDLLRIFEESMPTAAKILSRIYDLVLQEETIAKTAVEAMSFMNGENENDNSK
jgi:hypothetical protein